MHTFEIPYIVGKPEVKLLANGMLVEIVNFFPSDVLVHRGSPHHQITSWLFPRPIVGQGCFGSRDAPKLGNIGNLTFIPADTPTVSHFKPEDGVRRAIVFRFASDLFSDLVENRQLRSDPRPMASLNFRDPFIQSFLQLLAEEAKAPGFASTTLVESIGTALLVRLIRRYKQGVHEHKHRGGLAPWQLRRITEYLADETNSIPSIAELAELVGICSGHLRTAFKSRTGFTLGEHIQGVRFERACALLSMTDTPLKEIATHLGYLSQYGFSIAFKRYADETPLAYRQRIHANLCTMRNANRTLNIKH